MYNSDWTRLEQAHAKEVLAYACTKQVMWKKENKIIILHSVLEVKLKPL